MSENYKYKAIAQALWDFGFNSMGKLNDIEGTLILDAANAIEELVKKQEEEDE